ncbi:hypothetical protein BU16DRAFT_543559 [Lophium mytilinum]|uniref:F-box domain-containing protein n=1 Tax=Lophium mytilinum TaxID=390894 RepID=A0A6A6QDX3_9PEZI|nr:hypothetical protein BU16DRAFT_543559 [Lophium mytilinum]
MKLTGIEAITAHHKSSILAPLRPHQKRTLDHSHNWESPQAPRGFGDDNPPPAKKAKRGSPLDHDTEDVDEIPRLVSDIGAITAQPPVEVVDALATAQTKRMTILSLDRAWDINLVFHPDGEVKISSSGHPTEVEFQVDPHGELNLSVRSNSTVTPYLKTELFDTNGDERLVIRTRPNVYRPTVFTFLKLPEELRHMIYDMVLEADGTSGWLSHYRRNYQNWLVSHRQTRPVPRSEDGPGIDFRGHRWCLGTAQKLLWINRKIRAEVSAKVFRIAILKLPRGYPDEFHDLDMVRKVLRQINDFGRKSLRELYRITWWTNSWDGDKSKKTREIEVVSDVVQLLQACTNLQRLEIGIPERKGLAPSMLKPSKFEGVCGFALLRTIKHVPAVQFWGPNDPLKKWLYDGMRQSVLSEQTTTMDKETQTGTSWPWMEDIMLWRPNDQLKKWLYDSMGHSVLSETLFEETTTKNKETQTGTTWPWLEGFMLWGTDLDI